MISVHVKYGADYYHDGNEEDYDDDDKAYDYDDDGNEEAYDDDENEEHLSPDSPPSSLNLSLIDSRAPHLIRTTMIMMTKVKI